MWKQINFSSLNTYRYWVGEQTQKAFRRQAVNVWTDIHNIRIYVISLPSFTASHQLRPTPTSIVCVKVLLKLILFMFEQFMSNPVVESKSTGTWSLHPISALHCSFMFFCVFCCCPHKYQSKSTKTWYKCRNKQCRAQLERLGIYESHKTKNRTSGRTESDFRT